MRLHAEAIVKGMHAGDAAAGVVEQGGAVLFADQAAEQFQVAAQVEHIAVRSQDHVRR
ncbi:hypothetical protein D3C72_2387630 [compost metagenome]